MKQLDLKGLVFAEILQHAKVDAIIASSTLTLKLVQIHERVARRLGAPVRQSVEMLLIGYTAVLVLLEKLTPRSYLRLTKRA